MAPYGQDDQDESPFAPRGEAFDDPGGATASWGEELAEPAAFSHVSGASQFSNESFEGGHGEPGGTGVLGAPVPGSLGERTAFGGSNDAGGFGGSNDAGGFGGFGAEQQSTAQQPLNDFGQGGPNGPGGPNGSVQPERRYNLPLIIGGAVAAGLVLIGGGFGVSAMLKDDSPKKSTAQQSNSPAPKQSQQGAAPTPKPNLAPVKLKSRATDPKPLSAAEVFAKSKFGVYVRTAAKAQTSCTGAVSGSSLAKVLKKAGCSQVVRGTYARKDGKLIGTVGVLNLRSEAAAKVAEKAANAKDSYLEPLPGGGVTKKIGKGEALGTAETRGHYLIMTWVQRPDGKKIADKYHSVVSTFGQQVIKGSGLTFALAYRETEGKPFRN